MASVYGRYGEAARHSGVRSQMNSPGLLVTSRSARAGFESRTIAVARGHAWMVERMLVTGRPERPVRMPVISARMLTAVSLVSRPRSRVRRDP